MPACIVINGPSSAGKSTLARYLQDVARCPLLRFGVDELYRMVPSAWSGGEQDARHREAGFRYVDHGFSADGYALRGISNGADALMMLRAMNAAVVAMLEEGVSVVVDGQAFEPAITHDLQRRLDAAAGRGEASVTYVQLGARSDVLSDRNARHAHPSRIGVHQAALPVQNARVDLVLDTSDLSTSEVQDRVVALLASRSPIFGSAL
ncbi:phosphotransferase-like protein [Actinacidiphila yeochonensis]|uniref:phosphotransferase-like protein n=1 Tax=Actinacidiphila yeochonensis TaxID=89050 RepID=UPI00068990DC|nr:AAA family ATPase [Actinacidiphila yeochonensis]